MQLIALKKDAFALQLLFSRDLYVDKSVIHLEGSSEMIKNTIVVLPFTNMSADQENEYFSDGITEEIIHALAKLESLKVISRTSAFSFKNQSVTIREIARQLDVAVVLEGSVRRAGQMVRISAQLIEAETDFHFWSETWDRRLDNIFEVQDEVSVLIAEKLREQFGHFDIQDHLVKKQTEQVSAYEYAMKGRFLYNNWNPVDTQKAVELYQKAISLDPNHAESYLGLADAYGFLATTGIVSRHEGWELSAQYTNKAFELDPANAGVHYQLANLAFHIEFNFGKAVKHALRAIELRPNYADAHRFLAFSCSVANEFTRAEKSLNVALELDPLSQETRFFNAYFHYRNGNFLKALELTEICLLHNSLNLPAYTLKSYALLMLGKHDRVIEWVENMPKEILIPDEKLGLMCLAYLAKGDQVQGEALVLQVEEAAQNSSSFQAHNYLFWALVVQGKNDEAFAWLERVIELKSTILLLGYADPIVGDLKRDVRYAGYFQQLFPIPPQSPVRKKASSPLLDDEAADAWSQRLLAFMEETLPWLNPTLSLRSLADRIEIHPNQLSWLLNRCIGKNFNEFINHYRVETFKQLALDPANANISLLGLAYESGFNSKTVFNTYFKKETGMTPKAFIKQHAVS